YNSPDVATATSVTFGGISLTGAAAANYTLVPLNTGADITTITQAPLTVTANNLTRAFGTLNPPLTYQITGFVNGQTLATSGVTGSPDLSTAATAASPIAPYPINLVQATLAASNYPFTHAPGPP